MVVNSRKSAIKSADIRSKGNELFRQNNRDDYRMILSLYSESIAYAPSRSEELALAYNNRSVLWLHLHKYDLALLDIERALSITKSKDVISKLSSRRDKCLNNNEPLQVDGSPRKSQLSNIAPSESVHYRTDSVSINWNEIHGRHYVASRYLRPGEIIMCEDTPFASVDIEQMYLICAHCLAFAWAGVPCDSCVFTIYCSDTCKKEAWSQYHDMICALYSNDSFSSRLLHYKCEHETLNPNYNSLAWSIFMILVRMLIIIIRREGLENILEVATEMNKEDDKICARVPVDNATNCTDFEFIYSLMASRKKVHECVVDLMPYLLLASKTSPTIKSKNLQHELLPFTRTVVEKLYRICESNGFQDAHHHLNLIFLPKLQFTVHDCTCIDSEGKDCISIRGDIFAPRGAFFNHSCDSNVNRIFLPGPRVMFFSNRPIKKGEQLFIDYGYNTSMTKDLRQRMLENNYSFTCECTPCIENWPVRSGEEETPGSDLIDLKLVEMLGEYGTKFFESPMEFNKVLYDGAVEMLKFIYENSKGEEALEHASYYRRYLIRYLSHFYGEDIDLLHTCNVRMVFEQHFQENNFH